MPWCHRCKTEYRDGFTVCSDCKAPLSDEPPPPEPPPVYAEEAYLTTASNEVQAELLRGRLSDESIPSLLKYRGSGNLRAYLGTSNFEVDVYVPLPALEKAKRILGLSE